MSHTKRKIFRGKQKSHANRKNKNFSAERNYLVPKENFSQQNKENVKNNSD